MSDNTHRGWLTAHIRDAVRWNPETEIELAEGVIAGLGFVGPIVLAALFGYLSLGLAASAGSLPIGSVATARSTRDQARNLALALMPTVGAAGLAVALAEAGWVGKVVVVLLAGSAALVGGYSRTAAIVTTRFTLFLIITLSLAAATPHRLLLMLLLTGGATWTVLLWLFVGSVARATGVSRPVLVEEPQPAPPTRAQQFARWRASLHQFTGWQYTAKLTVCLTVAVLLDLLYPEHHLHWISLTIVLLAQRRTDLMPVRITQRALGAALGALVAGLCVAARPPAWLLIAGIGLIAGSRPLLKIRHYLSYSAMMTTLIVLMMDFEQPLEEAVLADRTIATLIGGGLVVVANLVGNRVATRLAERPL